MTPSTPQTLSVGMNFFLQLAKIQAVMSRRFDGGLGGLGLSEFNILFQLSQATDGKMRRTDLAEKLGLTASGVTRILLPMEKIGLVKRASDEHDGRVSFVLLGKTGRIKLADAMERAEYVVEDVLPTSLAAKLPAISTFLGELHASVR